MDRGSDVTARMSATEWRAMHAKEKKTGRIKGAVRTRVGDRVFDSALEAARYAELQLLVKAGQIAELRCQVRIPLELGGVPVPTPTGRQMCYVADFIYRDVPSGLEIIEDAKGYRTEKYRDKRSILSAMGYEIREIEKTKTRGRR